MAAVTTDTGTMGTGTTAALTTTVAITGIPDTATTIAIMHEITSAGHMAAETGDSVAVTSSVGQDHMAAAMHSVVMRGTGAEVM